MNKNCVYDNKSFLMPINRNSTRKKNKKKWNEKNNEHLKKCIDNLVNMSTFYDVTQTYKLKWESVQMAYFLNEKKNGRGNSRKNYF